MRILRLGQTGIDVSQFFFGAGTIGGIGSPPQTRGLGIDVAEGLAQLDEAAKLGVRVIDTADAYAGGVSERTVGEWARTRESGDVLIATKVGVVFKGDERSVDLSREHIARQLARSIEQLGRVDLYLSHFLDPGTPILESLETFAEAQEAGRFRAYGVCNVDRPELEEVLATADKAGLPRPGWVQNRLNLLAREDEQDVLPLVIDEGLGYTPFSPLAGGVLSDRYLDGAPIPPGSHIGVAGEVFYPGMHTPANLARVAKLRELARERQISVAGLALAWLAAVPGVTAPIVAPRNAAQWTAVAEASEFDVDEDLFERVSTIFQSS